MNFEAFRVHAVLVTLAVSALAACAAAPQDPTASPTPTNSEVSLASQSLTNEEGPRVSASPQPSTPATGSEDDASVIVTKEPTASPSPSPEPTSGADDSSAQGTESADSSGGSGSSSGSSDSGSQAKSSNSDSGVVNSSGSSTVVGDGTPSSCTSDALATAVRSGGSITFDCGPEAITIQVTSTLYTCNTHNCAHPWQGGEPVSSMTLDGGGKVTLSGGGSRGIFYANTCQESFGWLSSSCQNETTPHITFQNLGFTSGNASSSPAGLENLRGGGAIAMRGGQLTVKNSWFGHNRCMTADSDGGGGAIRVTGMVKPATISGSTFTNNQCANGGAISSLHATMNISGSTIKDNTATGSGASSGNGGNGGGVYFDGTNDNVTITNTTITNNVAPEGGPAVFYVSNNGAGSLTIKGSTFSGNSGQSFHTDPYTSIFFKGNQLNVSDSSVQ